MKIVIIGGTGHIGSYLVPRLARQGHELTVVARHARPQYTHPALGWSNVHWVLADRALEEKSGDWAKRMAALEADAVIDLICMRPEQNATMVEAFRGRISHFLHCGTIWAYGPTERAPYEESFPRKPSTDYGRRKVAIEAELIRLHRTEGFPATIIHPGHISGRRWLPIDPQGSRNGVGVYRKLATGEPVALPGDGLPLLHHVHGDDVAQLFERALENRAAALGESFSAVAPYALSLAGCCEAVAGLFGKRPQLAFVSFDELVRLEGERSAHIIREHISHSPCVSTAKGRRLLGYAPRYTTEAIYAECLDYLLESGQLAL